jgi:hypothetical protein
MLDLWRVFISSWKSNTECLSQCVLSQWRFFRSFWILLPRHVLKWPSEQAESYRIKIRPILQESLKDNKGCTLFYNWHYQRWVHVHRAKEVFGSSWWNKMANRFTHLLGDERSRTLGKFSTPGTVQQCIHAFCFVLSSEPTTTLKCQIDPKPLLDIVNKLTITMAVRVIYSFIANYFYTLFLSLWVLRVSALTGPSSVMFKTKLCTPHWFIIKQILNT